MHYSGFIIFASKLITLITGITFTLMVANSLSQNEYGVWGIFNVTIIPNFTVLSSAVSFWAMRFVAREKEGATKTGIIANMTLALIVTLVYLALLPVITTAFGLGNYVLIYVVAAAQVIETYLIGVLEACLQAQQPHFVGYGLLVGEVCKVLLAYVFILQLGLALPGVVLSIVIAFAVKIAFYLKAVILELRQKVVLGYIKEWLKGSAFNIYNMIGDRIASIIFVMLTIYGLEVGTGYYYAALQIANIITYSTFLAFALQPKLLAENNIDEATVSLRLVLMFAVPMTAGVIAIPSSYLLFLKESMEYVPATPVLVILAFDALIMTISSIFSYVLYGIEKVDEKAEIPFRQVMRSRLFIAFSLPYAHSMITLPTAFYALNYLANNNPQLVATYVTAINTVGHLAMFIVLYSVLRKAVKLKIPWRSIGKYVAASSVMAFVLFLAARAQPARRSTTLIVTAVGSMIYLGLLLAFDKETRTLARTIWQVGTDKLGRKTRT